MIQAQLNKESLTDFSSMIDNAVKRGHPHAGHTVLSALLNSVKSYENMTDAEQLEFRNDLSCRLNAKIEENGNL